MKCKGSDTLQINRSSDFKKFRIITDHKDTHTVGFYLWGKTVFIFCVYGNFDNILQICISACLMSDTLSEECEVDIDFTDPN